MFEKVKDSYFPDYDEIELDSNVLINNLQSELSKNLPTEENSEQIKEIYEFCKQINKEAIDEVTNLLQGQNKEMVMETIETVENWNFKLCIDQKKLLEKLQDYYHSN